MAKPADLPSLDEIRQLPADLTMAVPPRWEDRNGHVNVQHYLSLYDLGGWKLLENIGIDESYHECSNGGIFDLENHIRYLAEIRVEEVVSVHNRMLGRDRKRFHGMLFIVNDTGQRLASTIEYLSIHVDRQQRRAAPFPDDMAAKLDDLLTLHNALSWSVPLCRGFGI
ncbi:MAG: thioesterase family protein [Halioglobus sp.]|nr:thioesterase family protein [Halioglobus sp.]